MGKVFLIPPSDISNSNEKRMVEEKGDAWRVCLLLLCAWMWNGGITLIRSRMGALLGGAPYKYRREPKSIKIYKGRRR
ncbi:MAG: hypothetical protein MW690_000274 [Methanophagales archaeon]|nr:hypothetical protein [Methanophagales archaeon]MCU4140343.1 hypothetical protein [Methanophagales archaeon]